VTLGAGRLFFLDDNSATPETITKYKVLASNDLSTVKFSHVSRASVTSVKINWEIICGTITLLDVT
jgi:hypothetical protein